MKKQTPRRRRKWPLFVAGVVLAGGLAFVVLNLQDDRYDEAVLRVVSLDVSKGYRTIGYLDGNLDGANMGRLGTFTAAQAMIKRFWRKTTGRRPSIPGVLAWDTVIPDASDDPSLPFDRETLDYFGKAARQIPGTRGFTHYSPPAYTWNHDRAIVYASISLGPLYGEGYVYELYLDAGEWKIKSRIMLWVS